VTLPEFETDRLVLRRLDRQDAPFTLELLNDPSYIRNIGDRGVRDVEGACRYLEEGPIAMYRQHGFGLWRVERKADGVVLGMCGLLRRDILPDVDIGYAFLPAARGQGYAFEAAAATLQQAATRFGLARLIGVVSEGNSASIRVLEKLGLRFERLYPMREGEPEVRLYSIELGQSPGKPATIQR